MNKEVLQMILLVASPLLYMLGGYRWKWMRRYILPLVITAILIISGVNWWKTLLCGVLQVVAFTLPYGEKTPYLLKAIVGCLFAIPSLIIGFTAWQIILPVSFIATFILSNKQPTSKDFTWKVCEGLTGFLIGAIYATLI